MSEKRVRKTITIDETISEKIQKIAGDRFGGNYSMAIEALVGRGMREDNDLKQERNLNKYVAIKTLYYLRENIRAREESLLEKLDENYTEQAEEMKQLLIEEGVDYGNF